jgi:hypothetical protein
LGDFFEKKMRQNHSANSSYKKCAQRKKYRPNGKISPNLVTLTSTHGLDALVAENLLHDDLAELAAVAHRRKAGVDALERPL